MIISAFADEISPDVDVQIRVLRRHDIAHLDLRSAGGRNVLDLDDDGAASLAAAFRAGGISVATIASPIGKQAADAPPEQLRSLMQRAGALADVFGTDLVRVFSFLAPSDGVAWRDASLASLRIVAGCAREHGLTLLVENERLTYTDTVDRLVDVLTTLDDDHVRAAYDPANLLRCGGVPYPDGYTALKPWIHQVQVKDIDAGGILVPAGHGAAGWPGLLESLHEDGFRGLLGLEPHLLHAGVRGGFTGPTLFGEAYRAVRALIDPTASPIRRATNGGRTVDSTIAVPRYSSPAEDDWQRRGWRSTGWPFLACVNGRITAPEDAVVPAMDEGFLRGDGAFEVLHVYQGRPFALEAHLARFARSCEGVLLDFPRDEIVDDLRRLLDDAGPVDCLWRVLVSRGGTRLHFLEWVPPEKRRSAPVTLLSIRYQPTVVLSNLKPMSYGANMAATRRARRDGADEGLFVQPDGTVLEAPTATVFWAKDGVLMTPALDLGILPSITRAVVMAALETVEVTASIDEVHAADEVFLASTSREIQPVLRLDSATYAEAPGPLCRAARRALDAAIAGERSTSAQA